MKLIFFCVFLQRKKINHHKSPCPRSLGKHSVGSSVGSLLAIFRNKFFSVFSIISMFGQTFDPFPNIHPITKMLILSIKDQFRIIFFCLSKFPLNRMFWKKIWTNWFVNCGYVALILPYFCSKNQLMSGFSIFYIQLISATHAMCNTLTT